MTTTSKYQKFIPRPACFCIYHVREYTKYILAPALTDADKYLRTNSVCAHRATERNFRTIFQTGRQLEMFESAAAATTATSYIAAAKLR